MELLSYEIAKELEENGLIWEPKVGDWFSNGTGSPLLIAFLSTINNGEYIKYTNTKDENYPNSILVTAEQFLLMRFTWLPTFTDMMEILLSEGYMFAYQVMPSVQTIRFNNENQSSNIEPITINKPAYRGILYYYNDALRDNPQLKYTTGDLIFTLTDAIGKCLLHIKQEKIR